MTRALPCEAGMADSRRSSKAVKLIERCSMQDIFRGAIIIGIGLAMGGSIYPRQFTLFNFFFDGLGIFFIGKGAMNMIGEKSSQ